MVLYAENNQSVVCSKAESPRFSEHNEWYCIETTVDDKQIVLLFEKISEPVIEFGMEWGR